MVDYQTIGVLIAAASVVIGVVNSILVSRREEKRQELMLKNGSVQRPYGKNESGQLGRSSKERVNLPAMLRS